MTEEDARGWIATRFGDSGVARVATFLDLVITENTRQNLIAPSTIGSIWVRHAMDSAQLLPLAGEAWVSWLDIGTGGGFPGMVVALLGQGGVTMVEPRRKRAAFLQACVDHFSLDAMVIAGKIEDLHQPSDIISARAVASVENLLQAASGCAKVGTTWLLPRGRAYERDQPFLTRMQTEMFHVEQSLTDPDSWILVARSG